MREEGVNLVVAYRTERDSEIVVTVHSPENINSLVERGIGKRRWKKFGEDIYDPETDILYVRMSDGKEYDVIETDDSELYIDKSGKLLVIEVWNASKNGLESIIKSLTLKVPSPS
jgi:uncharacterized protein YuzE